MFKVTSITKKPDGSLQIKSCDCDCDGSVVVENEFFVNLLVALASNSVGDATALYEWYDPQRHPKGNVVQTNIDIDADKKFVISGPEGYEHLAGMPSVACKYKGELIGRADAEYYFSIHEEAGKYVIQRIKSKESAQAATHVFQ